jgi:N-acetylglucosamine kinase-like BadF-type ATPase
MDPMTAVLGVDGGQTAIRIRHSTDDREVEVDGVSRQEGDTIRAVAAAVAEGWRSAGSRPVDRVVLGLTTAPADAVGSDRLCELVARSVGAVEVWLADDAVTSHAGALSGCAGVSIAAGTGVACLAVPERGGARIIGGHGFLLGDEGGGFWIGRKGLRAALRAIDGRGADTVLTELAARRFGPLADVHVRIHDADRPIAAIAGFAPDVLDAALRGDGVAGGILDDATSELLLLARSGAAVVGGEGVPVALGGRLLAGGGPLRDRLDRRLTETDPDLRARDPDGSALDGAIRLGLASDPGRYGDLIHTWRQAPP